MTKPTTLTGEEKRVIKALLVAGERNQDIHALVNHERAATINFGRITGIKKDSKVLPATFDEVEFYKRKKKSFDPLTGLNSYTDERLIRSREAMIHGVSIFNSPACIFKSETFSVLAIIAWTYLLLEYYSRKGVNCINSDGTSFALSYMLSRSDSPLSKGIKNNLTSIKKIRDEVEHKCLGKSDVKWLSIFQACCLNYDKTIVEMFGPRVSLQSHLSAVIQFSKMALDQAAQLNAYDIPAEILALDARLKADLTNDELEDLEYQFRVVYTFDSASKGKAHIHFVSPTSEEGKQVQNVLQKFKIADELYRYKPSQVVAAVKKISSKAFTTNDHTLAWKRHKVRPSRGVSSPEKTNRDYCIFHVAHGDYTYNDKWVELLVAELESGATSKKA